MVMVEDVIFLLVILSQNYLLSPEKGSVLFVEIHLLLVADAALGNP